MTHQQVSDGFRYVALESAQYLTDTKLLQEYLDLQQNSLSPFEQLWKQPKFRLFVLRLSRLALFGLFTTSVISTITQTGNWNDLYFWVHRLL